MNTRRQTTSSAADVVVDFDFISEQCGRVAAGLPIDKLYLFGSYARGDAEANSDIDLACSFVDGAVPGIAFLSWAGLFERALGKAVDLLALDGVERSGRKDMRESFSHDAVLVYAR